MHTRKSDAWYWLTITAGCTMGETMGDFLSHGPMQLGYGLSSLLLSVLVVAALIIERAAKARSDVRYWTTIVVMSTAGTTMADFVSRTLHFGYQWSSLLMIVLFAAVFTAWKRSGPPPAEKAAMPATDARYWAAIMVASTAGTTFGDALSNGTAIGFGGGAAVLVALLLAVLFWEHHAARRSEARYWAALMIASTIGATSGDFLTKDEGLGLGYFKGTALLILVFVVILSAARRQVQRA